MGFDSRSIFILFGVLIPDDAILVILDKFNMGNVKRSLPIPNTNYYIIHDGHYFISLRSIRFAIGDDDFDAVDTPTEIIPPTPNEITLFLEFLNQHDIHYPYGQYFLP